MYIIKRIDQGGGYVAKSGSKSSYTRNIKRMKKFATIEEAEFELCIENEIVMDINQLIY